VSEVVEVLRSSPVATFGAGGLLGIAGSLVGESVNDSCWTSTPFTRDPTPDRCVCGLKRGRRAGSGVGWRAGVSLISEAALCRFFFRVSFNLGNKRALYLKGLGLGDNHVKLIAELMPIGNT
jgi:hypothetical protein